MTERACIKVKLHYLRESKVWNEAYEEGRLIVRREVIQSCLGKGMELKRVGELMNITVDEVQLLGKSPSQ